ncbi:MAG TPA: hypothetical protein DHM90_09255, partial [Clostridiaceae bacterium]|nr:hypothetical protein [Clostridiaceae bacterium]
MKIRDEILDHGTLVENALEDFAKSSCSPFAETKKVSIIEKMFNEREARKIIEKSMKKLEPFREKSMDTLTEEDKSQIRILFIELAEEMDTKKIFFDEPFLSYFMQNGYLDSTDHFFSEAREHDPSLESADLFQAVRNVWIMNSLQLLFDLPIRMTPSVFSYSMLYPYTDNYLDDPEVSADEKRHFNTRLQMVLEGLTPENATPEELKIFTMIHNIEKEYRRDEYPDIYKSLLLIQDAQVTSLSQGSKNRLSPNIIMPISFYKGGTSVLADAFLCKGHLSRKEMEFAFGYGAFLQLMDDLQDIESDRASQHWTLFSVKSREEIFDNEVNKLLCYIIKVIDKHTFGSPDEAMLKRIIKECTRMMIGEVIGRNPQLVSEKLYKNLESCSKVRLSFYKEFGDKLSENLSGWDKNPSLSSSTI